MKWIRKIAAAVSAAAILAGFFVSLSVTDGYLEGRRKYKKWIDEYTTDTEAVNDRKDGEERSAEKTEERKYEHFIALPGDAPEKKKINFAGLLALNPDVVGWIDLPAAGISYPVVQASDNEYYLHRALDRDYLFAGCLFLDSNNDPAFTDDNSIVYGHNMRDGSMFAKLKEYGKQSFCESCPYFWIYTPGRDYLFRIYSVHLAAVGSDTFLQECSDEADYRDWYEKMYECSEIQTLAFMQPKGNTVTLSTCTSVSGIRQVVQGSCIAITPEDAK